MSKIIVRHTSGEDTYTNTDGRIYSMRTRDGALEIHVCFTGLWATGDTTVVAAYPQGRWRGAIKQ